MEHCVSRRCELQDSCKQRRDLLLYLFVFQSSNVLATRGWCIKQLQMTERFVVENITLHSLIFRGISKSAQHLTRRWTLLLPCHVSRLTLRKWGSDDVCDWLYPLDKYRLLNIMKVYCIVVARCLSISSDVLISIRGLTTPKVASWSPGARWRFLGVTGLPMKNILNKEQWSICKVYVCIAYTLGNSEIFSNAPEWKPWYGNSFRVHCAS